VPNFPHTGITRDGQGLEKRAEVKGWQVDRRRAKVGQGLGAYRNACNAVLSWRNFDFDWFFTNSPPVKPDASVVATAQTLFLWSLLPLRVVWFDKDGAAPLGRNKPSGSSSTAQQDSALKRRMAFGHVTLDGHQLSGEESFAVELLKDDSVWYEILTVSRPASLLSILSSPMLRFFQLRFMAQSVDAVKKAAAGK